MFTIFDSEFDRRNDWIKFLNKVFNRDLRIYGSSELTLGETNITAYRGDRGKTAYDHSQVAHAPVPKVKTFQALTSTTGVVTMNTNSGINGKITLTENTTLTLSNLVDGDEGTIIVVQGATNFTLTLLPSPFVIDDGQGVITVTDGEGSRTIISYVYDGTDLYTTFGNSYSTLPN